MSADLLTALIGVNLAAAAAVLIVMALRLPVRLAFGARIAYALWSIVPLAAAASLLPPRDASGLALDPAPLRPMAESIVEVIGAPLAGSALSLADVSLALFAVWATGALAAVGWLIWRQSTALALIGRLTHERPGLMRSANSAVGPAILGVFKPRIVLPADFEQRFDAREQALVMAHERAHLAAWDVRINAAAALFRGLGWFNPLIHLGSHLLRIDQELACDEAVVARHPGERRAYAQALLKTQVTPAPLPLGCYWPGRSQPRLKERILMLTRKTPGRARRLIGAGLVGTLALGAGYGAWAAQAQEEVMQDVPIAARLQQFHIALDPPQAGAEGATTRRFVIRRSGETFDGDAIPPEAQADIQAALADGDVQRRVIVRRRLGEGEVLNQDVLKEIGPLPEGARAVRIQCLRSADGAEPVCTSSGADDADVAKALEELKGLESGGPIGVFRLDR